MKTKLPWTAIQGALAGALFVLAGFIGYAMTARSIEARYQDPAPVQPIESAELLLRSWEQYFLNNLSPPAKLIVERGELGEHTLGQTSIEGSAGDWTLRVVLSAKLEGHLLVAVLLHELAHVMAFSPEVGAWLEEPHGAEWGLWTSRLWMRLVEGV